MLSEVAAPTVGGQNPARPAARAAPRVVVARTAAFLRHAEGVDAVPLGRGAVDPRRGERGDRRYERRLRQGGDLEDQFPPDGRTEPLQRGDRDYERGRTADDTVVIVVVEAGREERARDRARVDQDGKAVDGDALPDQAVPHWS